MTAGPRARLIESAIELVREQGVHAAGLAALLDRSNASRNSLYQHFPAGKSELVETATKIAGDRMTSLIDKVTAAGPPEQWLAALVGWWKQVLEQSAFTAGCPIVGAALAESEPRVQAAAGAALGDWADHLATAFTGSGIPRARAASLASFVVSAIEGAIIQSRARKSTTPLDEAQEHLVALLSATTPA
ncbi:TetR/AcrR family transcriptional regulator [Nocardia sp. NBC_01009]|uniref:TetR/AcrR family transcriptional regulator n=1 Tax=Nocardia sp. NBC_01009 TaxID=2975996 RepID=UPI003866BE6B|nr:TetR/AcrR family transcriptional regulator [Nocardia sp. NBC_01009]